MQRESICSGRLLLNKCLQFLNSLIDIHFHTLAESVSKRKTVEIFAVVAVMYGTDVEDNEQHCQQPNGGKQADYDADLLTTLVHYVESNISTTKTCMQHNDL